MTGFDHALFRYSVALMATLIVLWSWLTIMGAQ
jgi:hypothetical protein